MKVKEIYKFLQFDEENSIESLEFINNISNLHKKFAEAEIMDFYILHEYKYKRIKLKEDEILSLSEIFLNIEDLRYILLNNIHKDMDNLNNLLNYINDNNIYFEQKNEFLIDLINKNHGIVKLLENSFETIENHDLLKLNLNIHTFNLFLKFAKSEHIPRIMIYNFENSEQIDIVKNKLKDKYFELGCYNYIKSQNLINTTILIVSILIKKCPKNLPIRNIDFLKVYNLICQVCLIEFAKNQKEFRLALVDWLILNIKEEYYDVLFELVDDDIIIPFKNFMEYDIFTSSDLFLIYLFKKKKPANEDIEELVKNELFNKEVLSLFNLLKWNIFLPVNVLNLSLEEEITSSEIFYRNIKIYIKQGVLPKSNEHIKIYEEMVNILKCITDNIHLNLKRNECTNLFLDKHEFFFNNDEFLKYLEFCINCYTPAELIYYYMKIKESSTKLNSFFIDGLNNSYQIAIVASKMSDNDLLSSNIKQEIENLTRNQKIDFIKNSFNLEKFAEFFYKKKRNI